LKAKGGIVLRACYLVHGVAALIQKKTVSIQINIASVGPAEGQTLMRLLSWLLPKVSGMATKYMKMQNFGLEQMLIKL